MEQIINISKKSLIENNRNNAHRISYIHKDHSVTITLQTYIEEYGIAMTPTGETKEISSIFPIENKELVHIGNWVYAYRFFDILKINNNGKTAIDYNERFNESPLYTCETSKTDLLNMSFEDFSNHLDKAPKQKTLTKAKKNTSN